MLGCRRLFLMDHNFSDHGWSLNLGWHPEIVEHCTFHYPQKREDIWYLQYISQSKTLHLRNLKIEANICPVSPGSKVGWYHHSARDDHTTKIPWFPDHGSKEATLLAGIIFCIAWIVLFWQRKNLRFWLPFWMGWLAWVSDVVHFDWQYRWLHTHYMSVVHCCALISFLRHFC